MEKPIKVKRKFRKKVGNMLIQAQAMLNKMIDDLALFTDKFPFMDAAYGTAWQTAIDDADDMPDDDEVVSDQKQTTNAVKEAMTLSINHYSLLVTFLKIIYKSKSAAVLDHFGYPRYRRARYVQLELKELMDLAYERAESTLYKDDLLNRGFAQADIDLLNTLALQLESSNKIQEKAKTDRPEIAQERIEVYNAVWDIMVEVHIAASIVHAQNYAKQQQYLLYPEASKISPAPNVTISGVLRDSETSSPIEDAVMTVGTKMTQTDADGNFLISFYIEEPTEYNLTIEKTGYQAVNTTVQFVPGINVVQDLSMTPETDTGSVGGNVVDSVTLLSMSGVLVQSSAGGVQVLTDGSGNYNLTGLPAGEQIITFSKPGYVSQQHTVEVTEEGTVMLNIQLVPEPS